MQSDRSASAALRSEWLRCVASPIYFVATYVYIYDATLLAWLQFQLWPAQVDVLRTMIKANKLVVLKARQLGMSWLSLSYALWLMCFRAPATILLFSLRQEESKELLWRLQGMYERLPAWMQARLQTKRSTERWELSTGSRAMAFSTRGGRSYTGTLALVDEADFVPDLGYFLNAVKPTIDAGGQLFMVSTSDKRRPVSTFKRLFRAAVERTGDYQHVFLPWDARPGRDMAWYERTRAEMFAQRGTHDDFYAEYPASPEEALAPEQLDRRLPLEWVLAVLGNEAAIESPAAPATPGLTVWVEPVAGRQYVMGVDPAEGNPRSDESACVVVDRETLEQVALVAGRVEPAIFAGYVAQVSSYYNNADVLVERNNHGHLVIRELENDGRMQLVAGYDNRTGWLSNIKGKPLLYGVLADVVRAGLCRVRDSETASQLASIEASTLRAPEGLHDDRADAFALAVCAGVWRRGMQPSTVVHAVDPLQEYDRGGW